jgi:hypothetical protein
VSRAAPAACVCASLVLLSACAGQVSPRSPAAAAPGPNVNLSGFPPAFRKGYTDGCSSARGSRVRDESRFKLELQYASGWRDGYDICSRR